jgi:hypothetical protein
MNAEYTLLDGIREEFKDAEQPIRMSQEDLLDFFNSLKTNEEILVWYNSGIRSADDWTEMKVGRRSESKKYGVKKVALNGTGGGKFYLYNRKGRISLAMGDMATVLIAAKKRDIRNAESFAAEGKIRLGKNQKKLLDEIKWGLNNNDGDYAIVRVKTNKYCDGYPPKTIDSLHEKGLIVYLDSKGNPDIGYPQIDLNPYQIEDCKNIFVKTTDLANKNAESFEAEGILCRNCPMAGRHVVIRKDHTDEDGNLICPFCHSNKNFKNIPETTYLLHGGRREDLNAETFEARDNSWCVNHGWIRGGTKVGDIIPCLNCNDMICDGCRCGGCGNCNTSDCCECSHNQAAESEDCEVCYATVDKGTLNDVQAGRICNECHNMNQYDGGTRTIKTPYNAESFEAEFLYYYILNEKGESPADFDTLEEAQAYVANSSEPLEIYERRNRDDEAYKMDKKMNAESFNAYSRESRIQNLIDNLYDDREIALNKLLKIKNASLQKLLSKNALLRDRVGGLSLAQWSQVQDQLKYTPSGRIRNFDAESFGVDFNEWADQELMSHGKDISFKDWAEDEGMKHGNTEITEWAQHEDESHDARYGAEDNTESIKSAIMKLEKALGKMDGATYKMHDLDISAQPTTIAGFEMSRNGEEYDGGSYIIMKDGSIINAAMGNAEYGNIADSFEEMNEKIMQSFGAESIVKKYGMIAAGVITAFALLPEIKKRF